MIKEKSVYLRLTNDEFNKLDELAKQTKMKKNEVLRNLIMTSGRDNLSMEILQRVYMLIQIVVGTMKEIMPEKINQAWMDEIIAESKKRYPIDK